MNKLNEKIKKYLGWENIIKKHNLLRKPTHPEDARKSPSIISLEQVLNVYNV